MPVIVMVGTGAVARIDPNDGFVLLAELAQPVADVIAVGGNAGGVEVYVLGNVVVFVGLDNGDGPVLGNDNADQFVAHAGGVVHEQFAGLYPLGHFLPFFPRNLFGQELGVENGTADDGNSND